MLDGIHKDMDRPFPCVLLLNDMHVSKDNIPDFKVNWREALRVCKEHRIGVMIVGGDLFYSRAAQTLDVLLAVYDALAEAHVQGVDVILANGNHDKVNQEALRGYCHVYDSLLGIRVIGDYLRVHRSEWDFVLHVMSYFPENGSFKERLDGIMGDGMMEGKKNFLYIHQGIRGGLARPVEGELPTHFFEGFDHVFVGHYHDRRMVVGSRIEYIGSSRQQNFGEDEEKGYTVLFSDGSHRFVKNEVNVRYRVVDVSAGELGEGLSDRLRELTQGLNYRVKVRVQTSVAGARLVDKECLLKAGASKVEIVTREPEVVAVGSADLLDKLDRQRIRENYEVFCRVKRIEDMELGLGYLAKIESVCGN